MDPILIMLLLFIEKSVFGDDIYLDSDSSKAEIREYCQLEKFEASCSEDHVIVMETALYGRMRIGRCVLRDYGFLGCSTDVLAEVDRMCSGRAGCHFQVALLHSKRSCPGDLTPFLEASFRCVTVISLNEEKCGGHNAIVVPNETGFLSSSVAIATGKGTSDCPWRIRSQFGQQINVTLWNFARVPSSTEWESQIPTRPKICYQLAVLRERQYTRTLTECEGGQRISQVYTSTTNLVEIDVTSAKSLDVHFLLQFKPIGCANPNVSAKMTFKRKGDFAIVRCNNSNDMYRLQCIDNRWKGFSDNCSSSPQMLDTSSNGLNDEAWSIAGLFSHEAFPYSILLVVSIGVALGVFIGGVLLVCTTKLLKKRQESAGSYYDYSGDEAYMPSTVVTMTPKEKNPNDVSLTEIDYSRQSTLQSKHAHSNQGNQGNQPCVCTYYDSVLPNEKSRSSSSTRVADPKVTDSRLAASTDLYLPEFNNRR